MLGVGTATAARSVQTTIDRRRDEELVAVISHAAWQRRFQQRSVGHRPDGQDRTQPFTIIGVTPPGFFGVAGPRAGDHVRYEHGQLTGWRPRPAAGCTSGRCAMTSPLAANVALGRSGPRFEATTNPGCPGRRAASTTSIEPGHGARAQSVREPLMLLLALVTLLLTVACASAATSLARVSRQREIACMAIGASRYDSPPAAPNRWCGPSSRRPPASRSALWGAGALVAMMTTSQEQILLDIVGELDVIRSGCIRRGCSVPRFPRSARHG